MQENNVNMKSTITVQEETSTTITKDSGYSTSCNSQSQKSGSFKSKSTNSASSGEGSVGGYFNSNNRQDVANKEINVEKNKSTRRHRKKKKISTSNENLVQQNETPGNNMECSGSTEYVKESIVMSEPEKETINEPVPKQELEIEPNNLINKSKSETSPSSPETHVSLSDDKDICMQNVGDVEPVLSNVKEFNTIVSMKDGIVLYCTSNLTDVLRFPSDMWLGRSFIDFVHPNDRSTFASCVGSCIITSEEEDACMATANTSNAFFPNSNSKKQNKKNSVYCCLRHYKSLIQGGYGITERRVSYIPCQLIFSFKEIPVELSDSGIQQGLYLIITARAVNSIYRVPNEKITNGEKVFIKHNNLCQISSVNDEILPCFGYLPHRTIGRSIFNFYHPEDLPYIKKIYQDLFKDKSNNKQKIRSKPIRFRCQNGYFATVETEWSTFINPWTGKLEFIVGHHSVIRGPLQPDVCTIVEIPEPCLISEDILKQSKIIQDEIHNMLNKPGNEQTTESRIRIAHEPKCLSSLMESLIKNTTVPNCPNEFKTEVPLIENISERDSVMLGEISPHHEYSDSKSSSETPPSYNQLNYDDNIQRFFESKPKTSPSHDSKSDESNKFSDKNKTESSETSEDSEAFNAGGQHIYQKHLLTEESLTKHNVDMEKRMVQKHKEQKLNIKCKKTRHLQEDSTTHGVKRSGSHSWENEPFKSAKQSYHHHRDMTSRNFSNECTTRSSSRHPNPSTWPPFNVTIPMLSTTNTMTTSTLVPYLYNISNEMQRLGQNRMPGVSSIPYVSPIVYPLPLPLPMYSPMMPLYSPHPINTLQNHHHHLKPSYASELQLKRPDFPSTSATTTNPNENHLSSSYTGDESSFHSSMYSLLKTDESSPEEDNTKVKQNAPPPKKKLTLHDSIQQGIVRKFPNSTQQIQYQLAERNLADVLSKDLFALSHLNQPDMVNVQLSQLYSELELEGLSKQLKFEDGFTSSSDGLESFANTSSDENSSGKNLVKKKILNYDKLSRLFEENAPLPPPISAATTSLASC